jgi:PAS domain S-box-containing protein
MTMPRYVVPPPESTPQKTDLGQTVPRDDVSAILSTYGNGESEYAKRMWDKVLLENTDDVVHVLSLKGLFQWVSPSAARVLEYEPSEIIGTALSSVCHPSDIVPVTRELKDTSSGATVNVVFRIRRKNSGYMWFEGHGSLHTEQGKGRKSIILVGRERPVYTLSKSDITNTGGIGENELWTKMSTSGMFLFVSSNVRQLLDRQPDELVGISIQSLMRAESKADFARILEHARTGKKASVKHEMINRRGQVLSAYTTLYPGDAVEGQKPTFIVAQTRLIKFTRGTPTPNRPGLYPKNERNSQDSVQSGAISQHAPTGSVTPGGDQTPSSIVSKRYVNTDGSAATYAGQNGLRIGHQDDSLASEDNLFDELKTTKSSSWQYEIRQLEKKNRILAEEVQSLIAAKKKRKRRRGKDQQKDCANCHTRVTPEWRRGPSGQRDLCNSCGLRWAKLVSIGMSRSERAILTMLQNGRVSPRTSSQHSVHSAGASDKASKASASPRNSVGQTAVKNESPNHPSLSTIATPGIEPKESPKPTKPTEGHAANMEGASGVPAKIEEGVEEPD